VLVVRTALSPLRLLVAGAVVAAATILALLQVQSSDFLILPDAAHPAAPHVMVQGGHEPRGSEGIYFVDVIQRQANVLEKLLPPLRGDGASLVPADTVIPSGGNAEAARRLSQRQMATSQQFAAAVALRSLGYDVVARPNGVQVDGVAPYSDAVGAIAPGDVIVAIDGAKTLTVASLFARIRRHRIGDRIRVTFRRGTQQRTADVGLGATETRPRHPAIGIAIEQSARVRLPLRVSISAGRVGGPSAGLAFALQVRQELGADVTRGYRVVATGAIRLDGHVDPVGGIKQKTFGARKVHADVFLVPAGENAVEAKRYAHGLTVIPVTTYRQALNALAHLPKKR
jgi:Lon-like protease